MISEQPDWVFASVFYDAVKSGLRKSERTGVSGETGVSDET